MNRIPLALADVQRLLLAASLACGFACTIMTAATAADPPPALLTVDWKARTDQGLVPNGEALELNEQRPFTAAHALKVVSPAKPGEQSPSPVMHLITIENPPITRQNFALNGWIQHKGVEGTAYLEMWTVFADGSNYFSRTLGTTGPMRSLNGDSGWREIALPFQLSDDPKAPKPNKLIVNAVLPGAGETLLSDLTLTEADNITAAMTSGAWWSDSAAGWVGGVGGSVIGLLGALVGVLAGLGMARRLVATLLVCGVLLGAVLLVTGLVALAIGQPYAVYYPLLLGGGLCGVLGTVGFAVHRQRYAQAEMRRMQALDA